MNLVLLQTSSCLRLQGIEKVTIKFDSLKRTSLGLFISTDDAVARPSGFCMPEKDQSPQPSVP